MAMSDRIYGYSDMDSTMSTSCHVYERDDAVATVEMHSDGEHNGFLFAEKNIVTVVIDGDTELIMLSPDTSHRSKIVHVMYLSDKDILSASADGGVNLWSFTENNTLEWKNYLSGSRNHLTALHVSSPKHTNGSIVATSKDGYLSVWSRETLIPILSAANGNSPCLDLKGLYCVELFESAGLLVVGGFGRVYVHEETPGPNFSHITTLGGHKGPVLAVASHTLANYAADGGRVKDIIISAGEDKALVVWDASMFQEYARKDCAHGSSITSITVLDTLAAGLSDTPLLVTASRDGRIRLWGLPSLTLVHDIGAHQGAVLSISATISYNRYGGRPAILSSGGDKHLKVWRLYRILNWQRRKHYAMFLACCGFIQTMPTFLMPCFLNATIIDGNVGSEGVVEGGEKVQEVEELSAATRVFNVEAMCREIISFL